MSKTLFFIKILSAAMLLSLALCNCSDKSYSGTKKTTTPPATTPPTTSPPPPSGNPNPGGTSNTAPLASDVTIMQAGTGKLKSGDMLTGAYTYSDADSDGEGASVYRWLREGIEIPNANLITYVATSDDIGKSIAFEVTPVAQTGVAQGIAVSSAAVAIAKNVAVVFVVDSSASMADEIALLNTLLNEFATSLGTPFIDLSVVVVADAAQMCVPAPLASGSCPAVSNPPSYYVVNDAVQSGAVFAAIENDATTILGYMPTDTEIHLVAISDSDSSISATQFASDLSVIAPNLRNAKFHAIVGTNNVACAAIGASPGTEIIAYSQASAGVTRDLCLQDFPGDLDEIINDIRKPGDGQSNVN